jgi:N-acylglucosamine-6-phosphate 2-epimerase
MAIPYKKMKLHPVFDTLYHGLVVSCQALEDEPLYGSQIMAAMARAAQLGGAVGIRANTPVDIAAIHQAVKLPIIGLYKINIPGFEPFITPTVASACEIAVAGSAIIALDATLRSHPDGKTAERLIQEVKAKTCLPVLADIDSFEAGMAAIEAGADAISTTLSGYTPSSPRMEGPDFDLVRRLAKVSPVPVFAEGRISSPEEAVEALKCGAFGVIVGGAITRPVQITRRFRDGMEGFLREIAE